MSIISTSVKISPELKARIQRLATLTRRSPHNLMVEALEREVSREEKLYTFVQEALKADRAIEEGGEVYQAEDVHRWLQQLANGETINRPDPWQK